MNWDIYKNSLTSGIRHYLVRSTRQGVIKRNAMKPAIEGQKLFPNSRVEQFSYSYGKENTLLVRSAIETQITGIFEGIDPRMLNLEFASEITQRTLHPVDLYKKIKELQDCGDIEKVLEDNDISEKYRDLKVMNKQMSETVIPLLFQLINFLAYSIQNQILT